MKLTDSSWDTVFTQWRTEEDSPEWKEHYSKMGYTSWEDWRWSRVKLLGLDKRPWEIHDSEDSIGEAGDRFCDATTRWRSFYADRMHSTFADLKSHPFFEDHKKVRGMKEHFPAGSQIIILRGPDGKEIVFDGHHRELALADMPVGTEPPQLRHAITEYTASEAKTFERVFSAPKLLLAQRKIFDMAGVLRSKLRKVL